jgi:hypothetical protein
LDTTCPKLRWRNHGSWYFYVALPPVAGRRRRVRQGGFETEHGAREAMQAVFDRTGVALSATGDDPGVINTIREYLAAALSPTPTPGTRSRVRRGVRPRVRRLDLIRLSSIPRRKDRP